MDISVVIPLYNEAESLPELHAWIKRVMNAHGFSYEIIFVNDGSTDKSWEIIEKLSQENKEVKGIKFRRNYGKSPALYCGFERAEGDVVITMDADLQDSPDEIPELYRMITEDGYDLVSGWKQKRYDPLSKTIPTKLFNATARAVSGIHNLHDFNCGLKAYRRDVVKNIEVYGEMHRYIPYLAKNAGFTKIGEKVVHHQARKYGKTKFGLNRFVNGYLDLITLWFLSTFGVKPMHIFGFLGTIMFLLGLISAGVIGFNKLYDMYAGHPYRLVTESPYFYLALTTMIIGTQLFLAGFQLVDVRVGQLCLILCSVEHCLQGADLCLHCGLVSRVKLGSDLLQGLLGLEYHGVRVVSGVDALLTLLVLGLELSRFLYGLLDVALASNSAASFTAFSMSLSDMLEPAVIVMCCSLPVPRSFADTFTMPLASISKVTSICGTPLLAGGIPSRRNWPRDLLSLAN